MKKLLTILILFALVYTCFSLFFKTYSPCDTPMLYKIGTIDPKFKLNEKEVLSDLESAENILSDVYDKDLFAHSEDQGDLTINFIFDERSALNVNINKQLTNIDKENASLQEKIKNYEIQVEAFKKKLNEFNNEVSYYNNQGGAPPDAYERLNKEQKILQSEANTLNQKADELNLATSNYNLQVSDLNENVNEFNEAIAEKPEEGLYDEASNTITIFFVNNKSELIHTIAHEFGHALGMHHVDNSKALMYLMSSENLELTKEDREELTRVCQEVSGIEYLLKLIRKKVIAYQYTESQLSQ